MEMIEYRCVFIRPRSTTVLAFANAGRYQLPRIYVPRAARAAKELLKKIKTTWGLNTFVLEIWFGPDALGACAIMEILTAEVTSPFKEVTVKELMASELFDDDCRRLDLVFEGSPESPLSHLGWRDEAIAWIESATGRAFSSQTTIEQWNAGGGFALLRALLDDGQRYWLKATGEPNLHEFAVTHFLWGLSSAFLPKLVATRKEWNAWLTEDAGDPLPNAPSSADLVSAATSMANLQLATIGHTDALLALGAFDQRLPVLRSHIDQMIAHLIEAMARQTSTTAVPLSRDRLLELGAILHDSCIRLEELDIPDTLIHNDLNPGNILSKGTNPVFIDWSEAAVGNPLLTCERLCRLNREHAESVRSVYRARWSRWLSERSIDEIFAVTPILAIYAYLHGRGTWIRHPETVLPQFDSYARSLARHMDRAAKDLHFREALCH